MKRPFFFIFWLIFTIASVLLLWHLGVFQFLFFILFLIFSKGNAPAIPEWIVQVLIFLSYGGAIFIIGFLFVALYFGSLEKYKENDLVNWRMGQKILYIVFIALSAGVVLAGILYVYMFVTAFANLGCNGCDDSIVKLKRLVFAGYCCFVWCVAVFLAIQSCFRRSK